MSEGMADWMLEEYNRDWLRARAVAGAVLLSSGGSASDSRPAHSDAPPGRSHSDTDEAGPGSDTRAGLPFADPDHVNAALFQRALADHDRSVGFGQPDVGAREDLRDHRR